LKPLVLPVLAATLALAACQTAGGPSANGQCQPEYAPFAFGETSNWLMIVGPSGCTDTLSLSGAMMLGSSMVTPASNGTAFVQGTSYGYTPNPGFSGQDRFVMSLTGQGGTGKGTSQVIVTVKVRS
jgi:hypothetical protein